MGIDYLCGQPLNENQILGALDAVGSPMDVHCLSQEQRKTFYNGINRIVRDLQKDMCGLTGGEIQLAKVMRAAIPEIKKLLLEYPICERGQTRPLEAVQLRNTNWNDINKFPEYEPLKECLNAKAKKSVHYMDEKKIINTLAGHLAGRELADGGIMLNVLKASETLGLEPRNIVMGDDSTSAGMCNTVCRDKRIGYSSWR